MNSVKKRISLCPNNFVKITHYACFFECSDKGRENWNALRPRGPFLFRSAGKRKQKGPQRPSRRSLVHGTSAAGSLMHVRTRSANLPKLAALLQKAHAHSGFKHMERFPHSSHAVRCYKCCLGLPLAFCAAFRCSLRWRFTTRLFVHVFLPFGFFDKLQKHRPVHSHWAVFFFAVKRLSRFTAFSFFLEAARRNTPR